MRHLSYRALIIFVSLQSLSLPLPLRAQEIQVAVPAVTGVLWQSTQAQHAYGLPDVKPKAKGTLSLDATALTFRGKSANAVIARRSIRAVRAGNERIELWGTGGRIMRMAIPEGGGLAAAAVMHHRVDMLTVEFDDARGGMHSAVFYLSASEADRALEVFAKQPPVARVVTQHGCGEKTIGDRAIDDKAIDPGSVLVELPAWEHAEVPAAYQALVYEHVVERLKATKGVGHVYRSGEIREGSACPQYRIKIAIESYKKGNQVVRAATGPIGMFTSATQMKFTVTYEDVATGFRRSEEIKASVRTESESTGVAGAVAKKLAKQYRGMLKDSAAAGMFSPRA